jgi:hypothetical protein
MSKNTKDAFSEARHQVTLGHAHDAQQTTRDQAHGKLQRFIEAAHVAHDLGDEPMVQRLIRASNRINRGMIKRFGY